MERLTIPDKKIDGGLRRAIIDAREVRKEAMTIYWSLKKYEDTELTPEQIMELKEAVQKLENIFGDEITVNQVIDFFVDFYIAQGDPDRVEKAELLTNEEAAKWQELKERDTAKRVKGMRMIFRIALIVRVPMCTTTKKIWNTIFVQIADRG